MKTKHSITTDARMNPELRTQVQTVRGGMVGAAEQFRLPERFKAEALEDRPVFTITDSVTGRTTTVSLCDYGGVRQALRDLFRDDQ